MKKKLLQNIIIVIACILLNLGGKMLAQKLQLPVWLDMSGTCVASYFTGTIGGVIAGVFNNLLFGIFDKISLIYAITSFVAAILISYGVRRGYCDSFPLAMISSFWLGIVCTIVSTPINLIFYEGYSGNMWGDALYDLLAFNGMPKVFCALAGEAIVEIVDKQACVLVACIVIRISRIFSNHKKEDTDDKKINENNMKKSHKSGRKMMLLLLIMTFSVFLIMQDKTVYADDNVLAAEENLDEEGPVFSEDAGTGEDIKHVYEYSWYKTYLMLVFIEIIAFITWSVFLFVNNNREKIQLEVLRAELEDKVAEQTSEIRAQQKKIEEMFMQTVEALSDAVDAKDRYTSGHSRRVAQYAKMLAARMGKNEDEQEEIYRAGLLHDIGKIHVPEEVINKKGKLTKEEYELIKVHPVIGHRILKKIAGSSLIAEGARYHHEWYNGNGYPNALEGENIPEIARILGVADSYDAMTSNRSYRNTLPQEKVRMEIENGKGTQFDPQIADIMLEMIEEDKDYQMRQIDTENNIILVVDDEETNVEMIRTTLLDEPFYEIFSTSGAGDALNLLKQKNVNLILLDVAMIDTEEMDVLSEIRVLTDAPIVFITGDKDIEMIKKAMEQGVEDYLTKPFLPMVLKEVVSSMLK